MLEQKSLRMWDVVTATLFIGLGIWAIINILTTFPLKDKYGGVEATWYVSPALTPLVISALLVILGVALLVVAVKEGGWQTLQAQVKAFEFSQATGTLRFCAATLPILVYIFLDIPRVDFFIASLTFMLTLMLMFYLEDFPGLFPRLASFYFIWAAVDLLLVVFGAHAALNAVFPYAMDIVLLGFLAAYSAYCWRQIKDHAEYRQKFGLAIRVAVVGDLIIAPIFKYILIVPLPKEGMVTWLFDRFWYNHGVRAFRKEYPLGKYAIMLGFYLIIAAIVWLVRQRTTARRTEA